MKKEHQILTDYLRQKGLKQTSQRFFILDKFLSAKRHLSADEIHAMIREQNPKIGFSTVYRTLKLFTECGIAREVNFGDGRARFERAFDLYELRQSGGVYNTLSGKIDWESCCKTWVQTGWASYRGLWHLQEVPIKNFGQSMIMNVKIID
jgi:Fe2+ or Zn2+ uptake regulation protein